MACMVPLNENVTHTGRRSQLLLSATRYGHHSSYIWPSVDRASVFESVQRLLHKFRSNRDSFYVGWRFVVHCTTEHLLFGETHNVQHTFRAQCKTSVTVSSIGRLRYCCVWCVFWQTCISTQRFPCPCSRRNVILT